MCGGRLLYAARGEDVFSRVNRQGMTEEYDTLDEYKRAPQTESFHLPFVSASL